MIYPTFEKWWAAQTESVRNRIDFDHANVGWHARDAEIADLKRQLAERELRIDTLEAAMNPHDVAEATAKLESGPSAFDAYVQEKLADQRESLRDGRNWLTFDEVQEKVDRAVLAESEWWHQFIPITHDRSCSYDLLDPSPTADYCDCHFGRRRIACNKRLAANRAKVKP